MNSNEQRQLLDFLQKYEQYLEKSTHLLGFRFSHHSSKELNYLTIGNALNGLDQLRDVIWMTSRAEENKEKEERIQHATLESVVDKLLQIDTFEDVGELGFEFVTDHILNYRQSIWKHQHLDLKIIINDDGNSYASFVKLFEEE